MSFTAGLEWTFNTKAEAYERLRPGYVAELYSDIFRMKEIGPGSNVMEIGIGGGQAALPVLKTGCRLTAVEYGQNFADICRQKFKEYPDFSVITGKFEDTVLEENAYDLIYSASAFHWIPEETGYAKVFQLLRSGGVFARFANHPYRDKSRKELHWAIQKVYAAYMPDSAVKKEYTETDAAGLAEIARKYGFTDIAYKLYNRTRTYRSEEYIELLGTYSDHIVLSENTRKKLFAGIKEAIDCAGGEITIYDTIDLQLARKP